MSGLKPSTDFFYLLTPEEFIERIIVRRSCMGNVEIQRDNKSYQFRPPFGVDIQGRFQICVMQRSAIGHTIQEIVELEKGELWKLERKDLPLKRKVYEL